MPSTSSVFSQVLSSEPTAEIPILYFTTHGVFDVSTGDDKLEEDAQNLGLAIEIPMDMTILKFNFVPINVCNYGGSGKLGPKNVADYVHQNIRMQLQPKIIMARYSFEYFLNENSKTTNMISIPAISQPAISRPAISRPAISRSEMHRPAISRSEMHRSEMHRSEIHRSEMHRSEMHRSEMHQLSLRDDVKSYKTFIEVPPKYHEPLYNFAKSQGLIEETILDKIMSELNDCKIDDNNTMDIIELLEIERESIMRGKNVMRHDTMMMKIIDECVKDAVKHIITEVTQYRIELEKQLKVLHITYLHPELTKSALAHKDQKNVIDTFNKRPDVIVLMQNIGDTTEYINRVNDLEKLSHWKISIPNKSYKPRYILNKTFVLYKDNKTNGLDWTITMFKPKTDTIEDVFTGLNPDNNKPETIRRMTLKEILSHLNRINVKTVILIDETCSVFHEITPSNSRVDPDNRSARRWANTVKRLNDDDDIIYGGKPKKHKNTKTKKLKNRKTQKRK